MYRHKSLIDVYKDEIYELIENLPVTEGGEIDISLNDEKKIKGFLSDFLTDIYDIIRGDFDDWLRELIDQKVERP